MTAVNGAESAAVMRSVVTALRALEGLSHGPLGVSALSRLLGVPKTTAHRSLQTLAQAGWVRPWPVDPSKWVLTGRSLTVGLAGSVEGNLRELARSELVDLRDAVGETVHLVVPDPPELVVVLRIDGTNSLRTFLALGTHAPLHATASGRALLGAMSDAEVSDVLAAGLNTFTESTLHHREEILERSSAPARAAKRSTSASGAPTSPRSACRWCRGRGCLWPPWRSPCPSAGTPSWTCRPSQDWRSAALAASASSCRTGSTAMRGSAEAARYTRGRAVRSRRNSRRV